MNNIPLQFVEYVRTIASLSDQIIWGTTRDVPVNLSPRDKFHKREHITTPVEIRAYHSSREYRELKRVSVTDQWLAVWPAWKAFDGLAIKDCFELYWRKIRAMGISEQTIKRIEERYEKFQLEIQEFKKHRVELRLELENKINQIGTNQEGVACRK